MKLDTLARKSLGMLLQRCSRRVAGRLFGHADRAAAAAADVRLPYCICFFSANEPVPVRVRPPLSRRARRPRRRGRD